MTFIYSIADEHGKIRYIGKSNNPKNRIYSHIREKSNAHKFNWLRSIINRGFFPTVETIDEVPDDEWQFWEKYWISQFKQWGFKLLNISEGGDGLSVGHKFSEETKIKMKKSKLGIKLSKNHRKKISNSVKIKASENPMYNRGEGNSKIILDKELIYQKYIIENYSMPKLSKELNVSEKVIFQNLKDYGIKKNKSIWRKQSAAPTKKVYTFNKNGELVKSWDSVKSASQDLNTQSGIISSRCRNNYTSSGFIWSYTNTIDLDKCNKKKRKVNQYDLNNNLINEFSSIKEASLTGFNENNIQDCCVGRLKSHRGFIWKYK